MHSRFAFRLSTSACDIFIGGNLFPLPILRVVSALRNDSCDANGLGAWVRARGPSNVPAGSSGSSCSSSSSSSTSSTSSSSCNPAGEETSDLSKVFLDLDLFQALVKGYMAEASGFLTDADRKYLYDSVRLITFELGLRFFADFLAGDVYFKTTYEAQNMNRARVQFALCESIEARESKMREILESLG